MNEHRHIPEPGETVYMPKPSWGPIFVAVGALGLLAGIYAAGFIFPPFVYAIAGAVFLLGGFRNVVRGAVRDYFRLPRRQHVNSAALPVETITLKD